MNKKIVVIGSVHLDVRAQSDKAQYESVQDATGGVQYAIGGCAYNVAWNLLKNRQLLEGRNPPRVALLTAIAAHTLDGHAVLAKTASIDVELVQLGPAAVSSGYVAHLSANPPQETTRKAITACAVERVSIEEKRLRKQIRASSVVYADSNISRAGLTAIVNACAAETVPLVIAIASDGKAERVKRALHEVTAKARARCLVSMNSLEAKALGCADAMSLECIAQLRKELGVGTVIVTRGAAGWAMCNGEDRNVFPAPSLPAPILSAGAGDALCAAVCLMLAEVGEGGLSRSVLRSAVDRALVPILQVPMATPGASEFVLTQSQFDPNGATVPFLFLALTIGLMLAGVGLTEGLHRLVPMALFIFACAFAGALGSSARAIWHRFSLQKGSDDEARAITWPQIVIAATAALVALFATIGLQMLWLPGVTPGDFFDAITQQPVRPFMVGIAICFFTGFGTDKFFKWVNKKVIEHD